MKHRTYIVTFFVWLVGLPYASAQLVVRVEPVKTETVSYEAIHMRISITNNSARDVVLAAPGQQEDWLKFMITDDRGTILRPLYEGAIFEPMQINAGQTLTRSEDIGRLFPLANFGAYRVKASVYYPPLRQYISSNEVRINVVNARTVWGPKAYRVPQGMEGGGEYREYSVLRYQHRGRETLYLRITRDHDKRVLATFPVGAVLETRQPQFVVDGLSQLHLLFLHTPEHYAHLVFSPNAELKGKTFYMETQTRPHLVEMSDGSFSVGGGVIYDPEVAEQKQQQVTNLSERPLGLVLLYREKQSLEMDREPEGDTVFPGR